MSEHLAITIGRQYGSGGREIGVRLGELLGIKVYDKELITLAAEKKGVPADYLHKVDEKATNSLLYSIAIGTSLHRNPHLGVEMPINDRLFMMQTEIIKEAVQEAPGIFVGRCADYILRRHKKRLSIFIHADFDHRVSRIAEEYSISRKEAEAKVNKTDKHRVNYYNFYTGKKWGKVDNYHVSVNSSILGIEGTAQMLAEMIRIFSRQNDENGEN